MIRGLININVCALKNYVYVIDMLFWLGLDNVIMSFEDLQCVPAGPVGSQQPTNSLSKILGHTDHATSDMAPQTTGGHLQAAAALEL